MRSRFSLLQDKPSLAMDMFHASQVWLGRTQCHNCGYEPPSTTDLPRRCPKCGGGTWERFKFLSNPPLSEVPEAAEDQEVSVA